MPKLYSEKRHKAELTEAVRAYDGRLKEMQSAMAEIKEENRRLTAETATLRAEREAVSDAMIAAEKREREIKDKTDAFFASQRAIAVQSAERAKKLLDDVAGELSASDEGRYSRYQARLNAILNGEEERGAESGADRLSDDLPEESPSDFPEERDSEGSENDGGWTAEEVLRALEWNH